MMTRGPQPIIELGEMSVDAGPPVAAPPPRGPVGRVAVVLLVVLCAATLTGSAVPQSHGPRFLWSMALDSQQQFMLTAESLIVQPRRGNLTATDVVDKLAAYDVVNGSPRWSTTVPDGVFLGAWLAGDTLLMGIAEDGEDGDAPDDGTSHQFTTVAVDVATGAHRWRVAGQVATTTAAGVGVIEESHGPAGQETRLRAIRLTDGQAVWKHTVDGRQHRAYGIDRLVAVAADGSAEVVRLADGSTVAQGQLAWPAEAEGAERSTDLQISPDSVLVSQNGDAHQVVTAYNVDTLRQRWRIERPVGASLVACGTVLCLSDTTATDAYDLGTGARRWSVKDWINMWPVGPGRLLVGNNDVPAAYAIMDADTGQILADLGPGTPAGWSLDRPYYLRYTHNPPNQVAVSRLDPPAGRAQLLGAVGLVYLDQCEASPTRLACRRTDGTLAVSDVG